jgi:hypothetical protein
MVSGADAPNSRKTVQLPVEPTITSPAGTPSREILTGFVIASAFATLSVRAKSPAAAVSTE